MHRKETPDEPPYDDSEEEVEDAYCGFCSGSGEGMYDGSRCHSCGGSGVAKRGLSDDYFGG